MRLRLYTLAAVAPLALTLVSLALAITAAAMPCPGWDGC